MSDSETEQETGRAPTVPASEARGLRRFWLRLWPRRGWPWPAVALIASLVVLFAVVIVRTAWLSEDAYFTFRCVENWVNGYGARWNVVERVQAYTHPLWFVLMSAVYFGVRDMMVSGFALSFACTAATVLVLVRIGATWQGTVMALGCVIGSKAFVDYSTSGLENPLSHLLLLWFFLRFWADTDPAESPHSPAAERKLALTCLVGGLLVCNRMDLGLILAPALVYALWPPRFSIRRVLAIGLGFSPLIVWELISLVYYGFLVPNTAYAKLGSGLTTELRFHHGAHYFENSIDWDPLTLACISVATLVSLAQLRTRPKQACAALGVLLYLAYVFNIGGDYMTGRFFSAPFVVAVALIASRPKVGWPVFVAGSLAIVMLAFAAPRPTVFCGKDYTAQSLQSDELVDDERGYRFIYAGLISERKSKFLTNSAWYRRGRMDRKTAKKKGEMLVVMSHNGGYMGFAAGPNVHYLGPYGITDPLLARVPGHFRGPGHIERRVPKGYPLAAIGKGQIADPNLRAYWADLSLIVSGPIWSKARWRAIWRMHTGANQPLIDTYAKTPRPKAKRTKLRTPKPT